MATPLPDGRVPMDVLLDEQDAEFMAEWAAADAEALAELQAVLDEVGERPLQADQLTAACDVARTALAHPGLTGRLLAACGGATEQALPGNDRDLWLTLAAGWFRRPEKPRHQQARPVWALTGWQTTRRTRCPSLSARSARWSTSTGSRPSPP